MGTGINTKGNEQSWIFELQQFLVERWTLYSSYGSLCRAFGGTVTDQTEIIRSFIGGIAYCFSCYGVSFCIYVHSTLLYVCCIAYDSGCLYSSQISVWVFAGDRDNCIFHGNLSNLFWSCNITFCADFIKRYGRQEFCTKCHGGIQIFVYASRRNVVILPVQQGMY